MRFTQPMLYAIEMHMKHDAIVIGSGEMACATAMEAAEHGLDVALIDHASNGPDDHAEGVALLKWKIREAISRELASLEVLAYGGKAPARPLLAQGSIWTLRDRLAERYLPALRRRVAMSGVRQISGRARFASPRCVVLECGGVHEARFIVIAVGSRPRHPERFNFDQRIICDSYAVTRVDEAPRHLVIVGAEAAGLEAACMFAALGSQVTLLDRRHQTLRYVDRELRQVLYGRMQSMGIDLILGEDLNQIRTCGHGVATHAEVELSSGRVETCDRVLVEAGRSANTDALGLGEVGIETDERGFIITDEYHQTSQQGVYAVGDVVGNLGEVDLREATVAIRHAVGAAVGFAEPSPVTIQTTPPISMHGMTEEMCQRLDLPHAVGIARYSDLPFSEALGRGEGMLKLVVSCDDRRLVGVHVIGEGASELVHLGTAFTCNSGGIDELANCPCVAHSLFEAYIVAAEDARRGLGARGAARVGGRRGGRGLRA
jgi:NAD(P) transhydrogenase